MIFSFYFSCFQVLNICMTITKKDTKWIWQKEKTLQTNIMPKNGPQLAIKTKQKANFKHTKIYKYIL